MAAQSSSVRTVISYNRPLTRTARRALTDYGIVEERSINEYGHWTEVDVDERPPDELLDKHELKLADPTAGKELEVVYETPSGDRIEVYDDVVYRDGRECAAGPEKVKTVAEERGWEVVDQ